METLVQLARSTDAAVGAIGACPNLPKGFKERCRGIEKLGFKETEEEELGKLITGNTPNRRMMVGVGGNSVVGVPTDQKYEWVYNHKTEEISQKEVWTEAMNYWHETRRFVNDASVFSYFTGYRGSSITTTSGDVVLGCLDYIKEKLPEEVQEVIRKLKGERIFNAFSLMAHTEAWESIGTGRGGIVIGNVWDVPEADRRRVKGPTLSYRDMQVEPIKAPQKDRKEAMFFVSSW